MFWNMVAWNMDISWTKSLVDQPVSQNQLNYVAVSRCSRN